MYHDVSAEFALFFAREGCWQMKLSFATACSKLQAAQEGDDAANACARDETASYSKPPSRGSLPSIVSRGNMPKVSFNELCLALLRVLLHGMSLRSRFGWRVMVVRLLCRGAA